MNALRRVAREVEMREAHDLFFGGIKAASFNLTEEGGYLGVADPRRNGIALVF